MKIQLRLWHLLTLQIFLLASLVWAADSRITELTELTAPDSGDKLEIVDVSDATDNPAGSSRWISLTNLNAFFGNILGSFSLRGDISPAQVIANTNDWAPTDCSTNTVIRFSTDQSRNITGLSCANADGMVRTLINVGANQDSIAIFKNENTGSIAANRFAFDHDEMLGPGDTLQVWYDSTSSRWRHVAIDSRFDQSFRRMPHYSNDFFGVIGADTKEVIEPWNVVLVGTAPAQAATAGLPDKPGIWRCTSGTSANSGCYVETGLTVFRFGGGERAEFVFNIATLTNGTFRLGFLDTVTSADAVDGAYIECPATGACVCKTSSNSVRTTSAAIATLSIATWYHGKVNVDDTAANVTCQIFDDAGNLLGSQTNSANIPTAAGREFGHGLIATNSGTVATGLIDVDYMALWWEKALIRGR